jgi:hypothetical protein
MRLLQSIFAISTFLLSASAASSSTFTVYAWPLSASSPSPYADVRVTTLGDKTVSAELVSNPTPPSVSNSDELVRIGLWDASTRSWHGSAASTSIFATKVDRTILVHVDARGEVFHIGIFAEEVPNPAAKKIKVKKGDKKAAAEAKKAKTAEWRDGVTGVQVVEEANPPMPVLNKPVVLNEGGFVDAPLGQEKSFLQK